MKATTRFITAVLLLVPFQTRMHECSAQMEESSAEINTAVDTVGGTNYIATYTAIESGVSHTVDVEYYDGLGYPCQRVSSHATPAGGTLVAPIVYDNMRRPDVTSYLPFFSESGSCIVDSDALAGQASFYASLYPGEDCAYSSTVYESGPGGRPLSVTRPGRAFRTAGRSSQIAYGLNAGTEQIPRFIYDGATESVRQSGTWGAGCLRWRKVTDEDGTETVEYSDGFGRKVLSRAGSGNTVASTCYVYDARDNLVCVIQPKGYENVEFEMIDGMDVTDFLSEAFLDRYCFTWKYDAWGNVTESHIPGGGYSRFVHDGRDRVVYLYDSAMEAVGMCLHREYDSLDRLVSEELGYGSSEDDFVPYCILREYAYYSAVSDASNIPCDYLGFVADSLVSDSDVFRAKCRTMKSFERIYECPSLSNLSIPTRHVERAFYYDSKGRLVQTVECFSDGMESRYSYRYDFRGNVTSTIEKHGTQTFVTDFTYDMRERPLTCRRAVKAWGVTTALDPVTYTYDSLGRLSSKSVGNKLTEEYAYDLRGWMRGVTARRDTCVLFSESIRYEDPQMPGTAALYSGNISETETRHRGNPKDIYAYTYDSLSRLSDARHFIGGPMGITNTNTERFIGYDLNGNINWLQRWGDSSYEWLEFNFLYDGNRLVETAEWAYGEFGDYTYDLNGNLTSDNRKCLEYSWNILNLPDEVSDGIDVLGTYCYMADGSKYSVFDYDGNRRLYVGSFVFTEECGEIVEFSVDSGEGRVKADWDGGVWDLWFVRDHLGSVRCVVDLSASANAGPDDVILEQNDYLPYGTKVSSRSHATLGTNLYRYAGKEEQCFSSFDFRLLDFGARLYDPWSCQWTAVDPLAEKYVGMSPYGYCASNPLVFVDPFGLRTHVFQNADGTYTVTDYGNPDPEDGDNNIYVGYLDKDGNWVNTGFSIGVSATPYSFYNSDGNQWISGAIIDPGDNSGIDFLDSMNPSVSLEEYMSKAGTGKEWDFKVTNGIAGNEPNIKPTYVYRGMPIDVNATGQKVFASGRDVGNIAAGKIAAIHGMPWALTALATDCYQLYSTYKRNKAVSPDKMEGYKLEGVTTKAAQRYGWNVGCLIHENMYNVLSWKRGN